MSPQRYGMQRGIWYEPRSHLVTVTMSVEEAREMAQHDDELAEFVAKEFGQHGR